MADSADNDLEKASIIVSAEYLMRGKEGSFRFSLFSVFTVQKIRGKTQNHARKFNTSKTRAGRTSLILTLLTCFTLRRWADSVAILIKNADIVIY